MIKKFIELFTASKQGFHGQETDERVILILRQHLFTIIYPIALVFLATLVPLLVKLAFGTEIHLRGLGELFLFATSLWYALLWLISFYFLTIYSLNTIIITNKRIIENEQVGFFDRKVSELHLYRIQDVSVHTEGAIQTILSFGNVIVQTAASEREFMFEKIPHPERVKDAIMQAVGTHRSHLNLS